MFFAGQKVTSTPVSLGRLDLKFKHHLAVAQARHTKHSVMQRTAARADSGPSLRLRSGRSRKLEADTQPHRSSVADPHDRMTAPSSLDRCAASNFRNRGMNTFGLNGAWCKSNRTPLRRTSVTMMVDDTHEMLSYQAQLKICHYTQTSSECRHRS